MGTIENASLVQYNGDHAAFAAFHDIDGMIIDFVLGSATTAPEPEAPQSGLLTIMFTDIEASTTPASR